uniref:Uncharacterized protein n=1 Tax=Rhizophora mucronata TaxID=61149 RepID=A0A2P2N9Z5_RHIMU
MWVPGLQGSYMREVGRW